MVPVDEDGSRVVVVVPAVGDVRDGGILAAAVVVVAVVLT